jgi:cell division protein FtsB
MSSNSDDNEFDRNGEEYSARCDDSDDIRRELEEVKESKRLIEMKFQKAKEVHREELRSMENIKIEDLLKKNGAKEYIQSLKDRAKIKEDTAAMLKSEVDKLKHEIDKLRKEVEILNERCSRATKLSNHYFQLYKDTEASKAKLETVPMIDRGDHDRSSTRDRSSLHPSMSLLDNSIPPPPLQDVDLDEIFGHLSNSEHDGPSPPNSLFNNQ